MLTEFNFHAPSFVVAGRNSVHRSGELLSQWGAGQNIMVVCGSKTYSLGLLEPLLDSIRSEGYDVTTPVVVTNANDYLDVVETSETYAQCGDLLLTAVK